MGRRRLALAAMAAAFTLGTTTAHAQTAFPLYGKDKWLGSVNDFTNTLFPQHFNFIIPENAGKWGSAAGTTRTAAYRWTALGGLRAYGLPGDAAQLADYRRVFPT